MQRERVKLGDICKIQTGKTPPTTNADYFGGDVNWFCPGDIGQDKEVIQSQRTITSKAFDEKKAILFPPGTLLVTCIGEIGRVGITTNFCSSNQQITGLYFDDTVLPEYAYYWFKANKKILADRANNAVVPILNNQALKQIIFDVPPLHIQEQIANTLDKADALRRKDQELLTKYEQLAHAIFYDMFGDPAENGRGWEMKTLGALVRNKSDLVDGPFGSSIDVKKDYVEHGEIPVIRTKNVGLLKFYEGDLKFMMKEKYETIKRSQVLPGDIVITKVGTIGNICIFPSHLKEGVLSTTGSCRFRPDKKIINPVFLLYNLLYQRQYMKRIASEGVQAFLNMTHIKSIPVMYPPLSLQGTFEKVIHKLKVGEDIFNNSNLKVCNLFDTLMDRYYA